MRQAQHDYYELLGVDRDAEPDAIRRAFRARARTLHPDVSTDPEATDRFSELSRAYSVLSRPTARLLYDRVGYLGRGNGGLTAAAEPDAAQRLDRLFDVAEVAVGSFEAARGGTRRVNVSSVGACAACGGSGATPGTAVEDCGDCEGSGRVRRDSTLDGARLIQLDACRSCEGRGHLVASPCDACEGSGRATVERTLRLRIPPGAEDGKLIRAEEARRAPRRGARDVYVVLRVLPDPDSRLVRYAAVAALAIAVALFLVLALTPDSLAL
jgi:molecular chaperone DnaJ